MSFLQNHNNFKEIKKIGGLQQVGCYRAVNAAGHSNYNPLYIFTTIYILFRTRLISRILFLLPFLVIL